MEIINLLANLPLLFFQALNGGRANACCAVISLILTLVPLLMIGILLSNKKIVRVTLFCQAILLSAIFMIYGIWIAVVGIIAAIIYSRRKLSGKLVLRFEGRSK